MSKKDETAIVRVVRLPDELRKKEYLNSLDSALWRLVFSPDKPDLLKLKEIKKNQRISTRIELTEQSAKLLDLLMKNNNLSIVNAVIYALNEIHTHKKIYFIEETTQQEMS